MTKWFIDDERFPAGNVEDWVVFRTSKEVIEYTKVHGLPDFVSFDHDLGGEDTSMVFINWLIEQVLDGTILFPAGFDFDVHSQNPIGAKNIFSKMENLLIDQGVW